MSRVSHADGSHAPSEHACVASREVDGRKAVLWLSPGLRDDRWDAFLQASPLGHFQQSSLWAQAKASQGWRPIRVLLTIDGSLAGGFQILARTRRFGSIGYVSKGPVLAGEEPALAEFLVQQLAATARRCRLLGLVVQAPDESGLDVQLLGRGQFLLNHLVDVGRATLLADVSRGPDEVLSRLRKTTACEIRQARRRGIQVRQGGEADVGAFFRLVTTTCERQGTRPDPPSESALASAWAAFHPTGHVRLTLAEYEGEAVAGSWCFCFGNRVTGWKKGWSGRHRERHPNSLLIFEAVEWASRHGYKLFDFCSLSPDIARILLRGEPLSQEHKKGRDFVHLSFGNKPVLLPESHIFVNPWWARALYRAVVANRWLRPAIKRLVGV
ncbi:MAG: lipid II:glycine glycyltransferase FemX [Limisphaerales bacterium]